MSHSEDISVWYESWYDINFELWVSLPGGSKWYLTLIKPIGVWSECFYSSVDWLIEDFIGSLNVKGRVSWRYIFTCTRSTKIIHPLKPMCFILYVLNPHNTEWQTDRTHHHAESITNKSSKHNACPVTTSLNLQSRYCSLKSFKNYGLVSWQIGLFYIYYYKTNINQ